MIEDPPLLKVRRTFPRPDAKTIAAFQGVMTGHLVDGLDGLVVFRDPYDMITLWLGLR